MNLYLLLEGRHTEPKIYPKIFDFFFHGKLERVSEFFEVKTNNYFLFSANGYPKIFTSTLRDAILDINSVGRYRYLILCLDADESTVHYRREELRGHLADLKAQGVFLEGNCKLEMIVQNRCVETWFLGNKKVYKSNPSSTDLAAFQKFYNVQELDPEELPVLPNFDNHARSHFAYLREMLLERNIRYSKKHPRDVGEPHYLEQLVQRAEQDRHIASFSHLIELLKKIHTELEDG